MIKYHDLSEFTRGYVDCIFFTENAPQVDSVEFITPESQEMLREGTLGGNIPDYLDFDSFDQKTVTRIIEDCAGFEMANKALLEKAYALKPEYTREYAGHDFWLTRNGHGAGFWDRGLGDIGKALSAKCGWCTQYPEKYAYFKNGKIGIE